MDILALIATAMLALAAIGLAVGAVVFVFRSRSLVRTVDPEPTPKAAVFLALRGPDARLDDCVRSLLKQDYPDYDLHIVVDSRQDPAWDIINSVVEEEGAGNVHVSLLRDPLFTCSLKCSALLQMLAEVDPKAEVIALIDGDVVPHREWLKQLAAPLGDEKAGATFGIPWYFPDGGPWAAVTRKVCWMPAAILMALCGWIWGGTAALPARVFRDPELAERWSQSVSSDASIRELIQSRHLRFQWVPQLVMPNSDSAQFHIVVNQLARSLTTSRLYLNRWPLTLIAVGFATSALMFAFLVMAIGALTGSTGATTAAGTGLGAYLLVLMLLLLLVEYSARSTVRSNGISLPPLRLAMLGRLFTVIPLAHLTYLVSAVKAQFARSLTWRGVRYTINGKHDVRRVGSDPALNPLAGSAYVVIDDQSGPAEIKPVPDAPVTLPFIQTRHLMTLEGDQEEGPDDLSRSRRSKVVHE